jgi:hypothetical protein
VSPAHRTIQFPTLDDERQDLLLLIEELKKKL